MDQRNCVLSTQYLWDTKEKKPAHDRVKPHLYRKQMLVCCLYVNSCSMFGLLESNWLKYIYREKVLQEFVSNLYWATLGLLALDITFVSQVETCSIPEHLVDERPETTDIISYCPGNDYMPWFRSNSFFFAWIAPLCSKYENGEKCQPFKIEVYSRSKRRLASTSQIWHRKGIGWSPSYCYYVPSSRNDLIGAVFFREFSGESGRVEDGETEKVSKNS